MKSIAQDHGETTPESGGLSAAGDGTTLFSESVDAGSHKSEALRLRKSRGGEKLKHPKGPAYMSPVQLSSWRYDRSKMYVPWYLPVYTYIAPFPVLGMNT